MKADYFISLRYLFSKTKYNLVSFISKFSIIVLTIAYFSFLTILSVFSGLEDYSLTFSKSFDPDIKIEPIDKNYIVIVKQLLHLTQHHPTKSFLYHLFLVWLLVHCLVLVLLLRLH